MKARLETTMLSQIVSRSRIYYDPDDSIVDEDRDIVEIYRALFPKSADAAPGSPWVIRLELDRAQMLEHCVTVLDVSESVNRFYRETVATMHSDDNSSKIVFRIRMNPSGTGDDDLLTEVRAFEAAMMDSVSLKGSIGIRTAMPMQPPAVKKHEFDGASGKFSPVSAGSEWILETDGRDLSEVLSSPLVDSRYTESNDICETLRVLGVEAARQKLYEELQEVLKDSDINPRHVLLLADTMTLGGGLQSINRHGINRGDIGPLAKCSFEETTDMLTNAAMFADVDRVNGVSASIMLGQVPPGGTGGVHPVLDESLLVDEVFVEHPKATDEDDNSKISDREEMCRRIMRFAPIDMTADDGWNAQALHTIVVDKK
jgi:DNA-directed RNA polymerase II subunit RPB1